MRGTTLWFAAEEGQLTPPPSGLSVSLPTMSRSPNALPLIAVADYACIVLALAWAGVWSWSDSSLALHHVTAEAIRAVLYAAVWLLVTSRLGTYRVRADRAVRHSIARGLEAWAITWGFGGFLDVAILGHSGYGIWQSILAGAVLMTGLRVVLGTTSRTAFGVIPRAVLVGSCAASRALSTSEDVESTMRVVGFVPFPGEDPSALLHLRNLGTIEELEQILARNQVDVALLCPSEHAVTREIHRVIDTCDAAGLGVHYFPQFLDLRNLRVSLRWLAGRAGITMASLPQQTPALAAKRLLDIVGATTAILLLAPVMVACAITVKLGSRGPILFRQKRCGQNGRVFQCLKFRTMVADAEEQKERLLELNVQDGPAFKIPHDPRVTRFGRFMRKFSLDELPQFFNVLAGDMSLVGPRPPVPSEVAHYAWWHRRRISVKPGLTCVWQVWGRNRVPFKRWVEMDLYYIDNWSLWMDIKLLLHTFRAVLRGTGM